MIFKYIFSIYIALATVNADEILGCGGFVKSDVQLDFSRVKIKLFTKKGSLKDYTDCAPNNGYYFLPLYDKGDYILQAEPPTGWSFDRTEVKLQIDGKTDPCSLGKDINFVFKGFGITGQVQSAGSQEGPSGIIISYTENGKLRQTTTSVGGTFYFTPVIPGRYTITASHPVWKFVKNSTILDIQVGNTELSKGSLLVAGYDVQGSIATGHGPAQGVHLMLFQTKSSPVANLISGCNVQPLVGFSSTLGQPLCRVTSNSDGIFKFPVIPVGSYRIVPHYQATNIKYEIEPSSVEFVVGHNSVVIPTEFKVAGLTVSGLVLTSRGGAPIVGATVTVDSHSKAVTKADGSYILTNIREGSYKLQAIVSDMEFTELKVDISTRNYHIPELIPSAYKACGYVISNNNYQVVFERLNKPGNRVASTTSDANADGRFCVFLPPGQFEAKVIVNPDEPASIQFFPQHHTVDITNTSPPEIKFAQLKAVVSGLVQCVNTAECQGLKVELRPMTTGTSMPYKATVSDSKYVFVDIPPGRYEVSIPETGLCWENSRYYIAINSAVASVSPFKQTGYRVSLRTSHPTQVRYELLSESDGTLGNGFLNNPTGTSTHCLERAGRYRFTGVSCHGYDPKSVEWSTSVRSNAATTVVFNAVTHKNSIQVVTKDTNDRIGLNAIDEHGETIQKLEPQQITANGEKWFYEFSIQLAENQKITIVPKSSQTLFKPPTLVVIGGSDCVKVPTEIVGSKGKILAGKIRPMLSGVVVSVNVNGLELLTYVTKQDGAFRFGPLDGALEYTLSASKENYFISGPDKAGVFSAHKMADVTVESVDRGDGSPLGSVLVSISGGENYRRNLQTSADGKVLFTSLSPGEYFMRPMMKEYKFDPNSKMISIKEGESITIKISGTRIAFSAYGMVRSLAGTGESNALVEARALSPTAGSSCEDHIEEATTDLQGAFRLRGLIPGCSYHLQLKHNTLISNEMPPALSTPVVEGDLHDLHLISLQPPSYMDVTVHVYTPNPEHYRVLRVKLGYGDQLLNPIQSVRIDPNIVGQRKVPIPYPGVLVMLGSVPLDSKQYYVQLESTLSQASHTYETEPIFFESNTSFKHFDLGFHPKTKASESDLNQTSIMVLPFTLIIGLLIYNMNKLSLYVSGFITKLNIAFNSFGSQHSSSKQYPGGADFAQHDYAEIEQIVQNINAPKQKTKKKVMLIS